MHCCVVENRRYGVSYTNDDPNQNVYAYFTLFANLFDGIIPDIYNYTLEWTFEGIQSQGEHARDN